MKSKLLALLAASAALILTGSRAFAHTEYLNTNPSFDTVYQIQPSGTSNTVEYSFEFLCHLTPSGGESAIVLLEESPDYDICYALWGFCEHWHTIARVGFAADGTVPTGTSLALTSTAHMCAAIDSSQFLRLRPITSGSPTITLMTSREMSP